MKTATLEVPIYETPEGQPTCATDISKGYVCRFLQGRRLGQEEICALSMSTSPLIRRGSNQLGYLIPCTDCPFHKSTPQHSGDAE
jgi:hypothetical protein